MKGAIRIQWTIDGETAKDETVPYFTTTIETVSDSAVIRALGVDSRIEFTLTFDPPVEPG